MGRWLVQDSKNRGWMLMNESWLQELELCAICYILTPAVWSRRKKPRGMIGPNQTISAVDPYPCKREIEQNIVNVGNPLF